MMCTVFFIKQVIMKSLSRAKYLFEKFVIMITKNNLFEMINLYQSLEKHSKVIKE